MDLKDIDYGLSGIYKIIFDNDKMYIGLSNDIRSRMIEHFGRDLKEKPNLLISKAIQNHKVKDIEILEFINENDRKKLINREKYWISFYNTYLDKNKGYNMTPGGDGSPDGIYNNASYLSEKDLNNIYDLLQNSNLNYTEIADRTYSSYSIVSRINNGVHYRNNNFSYPLRKKRIEHFELNNKNSAFYNNENLLLLLIQDLKEDKLSTKELLNKYQIKQTTLSLINQGKKYRQEDEIYPLRKVDKGKTTRRIFTDEEMINIKNYLSNSTKTMGEIAKIIKCDQKVISAINQGKRQKNNDWDYPLRKIPLKTGPKNQTKPVSTILESEE